MKFEVTILGSNSATPTSNRFPSCHMLNSREKLFMVDCGEGAQIQLRRNRMKFSRLNHIFITHMHGDHCLGLPGMIASFSLLGRKHDLHIYGHADLERVLDPVIQYFAHDLKFKIVYHHLDLNQHALVYEDRSIEVWSIPLDHKVPTSGFLFKEKPRERKMIKEKIIEFSITIDEIIAIKNGSDLRLENGMVIPNHKLTTEPKPAPRSYAYISDTRYKPDIVPLIEGVDLLYHEATFATQEDLNFTKTYHSTAEQAALIAKSANAKKLLIGHFSARYRSSDEHEKIAKEIFKNTVAVSDGMSFKVE